MTSVLGLARPDLLEFQPYRHARWAPGLERLHANESPWCMAGDRSPAGLNRYPEPQPRALIERLAELYGVPVECVLAGRGSDEAIDLLARGFCRAGLDAVLTCPPTFGMYKVAARIQGAAVVELPLRRDTGFALDTAAIGQRVRVSDSRIKIVFICSPNNPTGNLADPAAVEHLCAALSDYAIVVVDEAYIEFSGAPSLAARLPRLPNLVVLRTLSKAFALAGARCGALLGDPALVEFLRRLLPPYALPSPSIQAALEVLEPSRSAAVSERARAIVGERTRVAAAMARLPSVRTVWPSAANFLLVDCVDAGRCLRAALAAGLLVRDLRGQPELSDSLRVTIGTPDQNDRLLRALEAA
ncbi:MAG TPA: histidinol-phosphate transaminase [Woeseiaceae bacterium]|nr:histidinol-phosphate transaminase [Woeseiaceae bacterium]